MMHLNRHRKPARIRLSAEFVGEILLLALVSAFFLYLFIESLHWPLGAALMPRIIVAIGAPFVVLRAVALLRGVESVKTSIMDTGFELGWEPSAEAKRFARISIFIAGLYLAIWIFGFHVALPVGVFLYLLKYGRIGFIKSALVGLSFLALITGLYDYVFHTRWDEPLILHLWSWVESSLDSAGVNP